MSHDHPPSFLTSVKSDTQGYSAMAWAVALCLCAAYVVWIASLRTFPLQDFPNHVARGVIMADLLFHHGTQFGSSYALSWVPVPYLLHDLVLMIAIELFGPRTGGAVFLTIVFLSLPAAMLYYMRATRLAPQAAVFAFLVSLYLASDWFFVMDFMAYRLGLAFVIVSFALAQRLRAQWSRSRYALYVLAIVLGYLTHLAAPVFYAAVLGVSAVVRLALHTSTLRREVSLALPIAAVLAAHFLVIGPLTTTVAPYDYVWGTVHEKLTHALYQFDRFGARPAWVLPLILAACLLWPVRRSLTLPALARPAVLEALAIALAFIALYVVMPEQRADSAFVDVRALSVTVLMVLIACLNLADPAARGRTFVTWPVLSLAAALAVVNLAYLAKHVGADDAFLTRYRQADAVIPIGARVLPVNTRPKEGTILPFLHAGSLLVLDRHALIPYLFGGDRGDPMKYFLYRHRPYMPEEQWYHDQLKWDADVPRTYIVEGQPYTWRFHYSSQSKQWSLGDLTPVDWNRVACDYDFIVATRPLDMKLIGVSTQLVTENEAAVVLRVDRRACHPESIVTPVVRLPTEH